ncbi:MAG: hypothetical protein P8Z37_11595 [Acidobacteriota bacterium]
MKERESLDCDDETLKTELLHALEKARGYLAVAIAEETKSTPGLRRKHYLETAESMQRSVSGLRACTADDPLSREKWAPALEALKRAPLRNGAQNLCSCLQDIVASLNGWKS